MSTIQKRGLTGGEEGEVSYGFNHPFFHDGVKAVQLIGKNTYGVRLLPAFDKELLASGDPNYKTSIAPYRDMSKEDPTNPDAHVPFSGWYVPVRGYNFVGTERKQFLSPLSTHEKDIRGVDPLSDIYWTAKNSPEWMHLTVVPKTKAEGLNSVIPKLKRFAIANAAVDIQKTNAIENRIVVLGSMCLQMVKETLNTWRPAHVREIIDPNNERYLFGDVTSPEFGSWATVKETVFNDGGFKDAGFHFSSKAGTLSGRMPWPFNPNDGDWGAALIAGRYNIQDIDTVVKLATSQEILDYLVTDGCLPYELIQLACGNHFEIPAESTHAEYSQPEGGQLGHAAADAPSRPAAPARPASAAAPARPAAAAAPRAAAPAPAARPAAAAAPARPAASAPARPAAAAPARPASAAAPARPAAAAPVRPTPAQPHASQAKPAAPPRPVSRPAAAAPARPAAAPARPAPAAPAAEAPAEPDGTVPPEPLVDVPAVEPLTEAELAEYTDLTARFTADTNSLSADEVARYGELADRYSATAQQ